MAPRLETLSLTTFCDFLANSDPKLEIPWQKVPICVRKLIFQYFRLGSYNNRVLRNNLLTQSFLAYINDNVTVSIGNKTEVNHLTINAVDIFPFNTLPSLSLTVHSPLTLSDSLRLILLFGKSLKAVRFMIDPKDPLSENIAEYLKNVLGHFDVRLKAFTGHYITFCQLMLTPALFSELTTLILKRWHGGFSGEKIVSVYQNRRSTFFDENYFKGILLDGDMLPNLEKLTIPWFSIVYLTGHNPNIGFFHKFPKLKQVHLLLHICFSGTTTRGDDSVGLNQLSKFLSNNSDSEIRFTLEMVIYQFPFLHGIPDHYFESWTDGPSNQMLVKTTENLLAKFGHFVMKVKLNSVQEISVLAHIGKHCTNLEAFHILYAVNFDCEMSHALLPIFNSSARGAKMCDVFVRISEKPDPFLLNIFPCIAENCFNLSNLDFAFHQMEHSETVNFAQQQACKLIPKLWPTASFTWVMPKSAEMNKLIKTYLPSFSRYH